MARSKVKKDLSDRINEMLPEDGGNVNLTALKTEDLELLLSKVNLIWDQIAAGGEEIADDIIAKKAAKMGAKRFGMDKDESDAFQSVVKKRLKDGPFLTFGKKFLKKRLLDDNNEDVREDRGL